MLGFVFIVKNIPAFSLESSGIFVCAARTVYNRLLS